MKSLPVNINPLAKPCISACVRRFKTETNEKKSNTSPIRVLLASTCRNVFHFVRKCIVATLLITASRFMYGSPDSGIREIFACGIRNPGFGESC